MSATLKNYRVAPRKVRLLADMVRGKKVSEALTLLSHTTRRAAPALQGVIVSAFANAKQKDTSLTEDTAAISAITVDKGRTIVRYMLRARGRAAPINRESSHVTVTVVKKEGALKGVRAKKAGAKTSRAKAKKSNTSHS